MCVCVCVWRGEGSHWFGIDVKEKNEKKMN